MIDSVMTTLFPVVSGEIPKTDTGTQENPNSNGSDFGQVLSILMAQMGLTAVPLQQDGNSLVVLGAEDNPDAQVENIPSNISNLIDTKLHSNIESGIAEEIIPLPNSGVELDSAVDQENVQVKKLPLVEVDVKQNTNVAPEIQNDLLLQLGTDLERGIAKMQSELPVIEQVDVAIKNSAHLNSSQKENLSVNNQKLIIPTNMVQVSKVETVELSQIQDKLHIKNVELSTIGNPEEQQELGLLKSGQVLHDRNNQSRSVEAQSNVQQKYIDAVAELKNYLTKNIDEETRGSILSKVLETELIANSGEQNSSNSQRKSDLSNSNPQQGIFSEKSMKIGNEGVSAKAPSIVSAESKEVVAKLSSLRSVLTEQIKFAVRSETKTITIRLEPESLGLMEIKVQEHSGKIGIQLTTSNSEIQKIVTQGLPQLREILKQEGIFVKDVQVISTGTASLMLNQDFNSHSFSKEVQIEPTIYHLNRDLQQTVEETKPLSDYHNGTLSLWV